MSSPINYDEDTKKMKEAEKENLIKRAETATLIFIRLLSPVRRKDNH